MRLRPRIPVVLAALLAVAAPVWAGQTTIVLSEPGVDLGALRARAAAARAESEPGEIRSLAAPALDPSVDSWVVPFVVDTGNPVGTTTLLSVRNEAEFGGAFDVEVEFFDATFTPFHSVIVNLDEDGIQSFNLRDQPGLPGGLARGFARATPAPGGLISADYFEVTPDEGFATGGLAIDFAEERCEFWQVRVLVGGPFTGGTTLTFLVDGPRGTNPTTDPPTITGTAYNEAGTAVNTFQIFTNDWVFELDAADLILPANLFGSLELVIDSVLGGGYVITGIGAEGVYSVGYNGVCKDSVPIP